MSDFAEVFSRAPAAGGRGRRAAAGLALSGGGFRAMLFHVGSLRRLHEIDALRHIERISSVSGGSIANAILAKHWDELHADDARPDVFERTVQRTLYDFASSKLDVTGGISGILRPKRSIAQTMARRYDKLFGGWTLGDLPDSPRFVFCATNMGTGSQIRFAKPYTADYRVGKRDRLDLPLGSVVAASAAFPPVLSPMVIELDDDQALTQSFAGEEDGTAELAGKRPYTHRLELSDGGVYDNLGLQPIEQFRTMLVSDGGGPFAYEESGKTNWLSHMIRAWKVTDNQVRSLRRADLVGEFIAEQRNGAFWSVQTDYGDYARSVLEVDPAWPATLSRIPTRLWPMPERQRKQLINWSYCLTDAAIRSFVTNELDPVPVWPYPEEALSAPPARAGDRQ